MSLSSQPRAPPSPANTPHTLTTTLTAYKPSSTNTGPCRDIKTVFPGTNTGIPIIKARQLQDCLVFITGIPILVQWHPYIKTAPRILLTELDQHNQTSTTELHCTVWTRIFWSIFFILNWISNDFFPEVPIPHTPVNVSCDMYLPLRALLSWQLYARYNGKLNTTNDKK